MKEIHCFSDHPEDLEKLTTLMGCLIYWDELNRIVVELPSGSLCIGINWGIEEISLELHVSGGAIAQKTKPPEGKKYATN